jgi:excisionase family DNA binding protein
MEKLLTTRELAEAIGASESSLRRWTNSGAIQTSRTVGGHRRIPLSAAIRFIRETGATVVRPEVLGLADLTANAGADARAGGEEALYQALVAGDGPRARGQILALYLGGGSLATLFDQTIAPAMHRVGELWTHDPRGILVEHRATDICIQAVNQVRQLLAPPRPDALAAVGCAAPGDAYLLPSMMAAAVLADAGYRVTNLGADTPLDVLAAAAAEQKAALAWLSVSAVQHETPLKRGIVQLAQTLRQQHRPLLLGGRHAAPLVPPDLPNAHFLATMTELAAFTRAPSPPATATHDTGRAPR